MKNLRKWGATLGAGAVVLTLAGCADKNGNGQAESPADATNVGGAVKDNLGDTANAVGGAVGGAANAVGGAANAVGGAVGGAANATSNAVAGAGKAVVNAGEAGTMTPKVKTALGNNPGLKGSNINVTTMGGNNSISLTGSVKSAAQKTMAAAIAKKNAPGYTINNQLKVGK